VNRSRLARSSVGGERRRPTRGTLRTLNEHEFYEALLPLVERQLGELREAKEDELARLEIDSVAVAAEGDVDLHIAVLFRDPTRPDCRFGWRWSWTEGPRPEELEFAAAVLVTNLEEDILSDRYGLPDDCDADGVTWF
jgi:hypothetical protein